jgi:hypothetical protein
MQTTTTIGYVNPQEGDKVSGTYFGKPFTGIVTKLRFHDVTRDAMWYVKTDQMLCFNNNILIRLPDALECVNGNSIKLAR